jgi:hypothetical protein
MSLRPWHETEVRRIPHLLSSCGGAIACRNSRGAYDGDRSESNACVVFRRRETRSPVPNTAQQDEELSGDPRQEHGCRPEGPDGYGFKAGSSLLPEISQSRGVPPQ